MSEESDGGETKGSDDAEDETESQVEPEAEGEFEPAESKSVEGTEEETDDGASTDDGAEADDGTGTDDAVGTDTGIEDTDDAEWSVDDRPPTAGDSGGTESDPGGRSDDNDTLIGTGLSLLFPGAGHYYVGSQSQNDDLKQRGVYWLIGGIAAYVVLGGGGIFLIATFIGAILGIPMLLLLPVVHLASAADAYLQVSG